MELKKPIKINLDDYKDYPNNYNHHPQHQIEEIKRSIEKFGQPKNIVVWDGFLLSGHGFRQAAAELEITTVMATDYTGVWNKEQAEAWLIADNETARLAERDINILTELLEMQSEPAAVPGVDESLLDSLLDDMGDNEDTGNTETGESPKIDKADELQATWQVREGDVYECKANGLVHRVICGDCTKEATLSHLIGNEKIVLSSQDPPYGMGKEKDGIKNDNLYREKLDAFQMKWWKASRPFLEDNASAYIWGNAEDLWRLWYNGGLKSSERLTFRNLITWDKANLSGKYDGNGIGSSIGRMYASIAEFCLFFMLGEQGFNNNTDNYWDGWESIRLYLLGERQTMGWDVPTMKRIVGHSVLSRDHWTSKSQWNFVTKKVYVAMQQAAKGKAFLREYDDLKREYDDLKREYDDLKREFYSTRAYFNNTHDLMTDVWNFPRVKGEERHGHATPKPVEMIERIIKSSSRERNNVLDCFLGSGTTLIACHSTSRQCRGVEIHPPYVAVTLQRFQDLTGVPPTLVENIYE
jgi:DNA modification methylase